MIKEIYWLDYLNESACAMFKQNYYIKHKSNKSGIHVGSFKLKEQNATLRETVNIDETLKT